MMLSLYSLLLRAVVQPLLAHVGAPRMPRYARMAVPLASLSLARACRRSWCRDLSIKSPRDAGNQEEKEFSPQRSARSKSTARRQY
jgi:hypothetical protein